MSELLSIKGVGKKTLSALHDAGLFTFEHVKNTFPKRYEHLYLTPFSDVDNTYEYFEARVVSTAKIAYLKKTMQLISFYVSVDHQTLLVKIYNQRYVLRLLANNPRIVIFGKRHDTRSEIVASKVILFDNFKPGIFPVYNISNLTDQKFLSIVQHVLKQLPPSQETLPRQFIDKYDLMASDSFTIAVHQPRDKTMLKRVVKRLKYETIFKYQLKVHLQKHRLKNQSKTPKKYHKAHLDDFIKDLPFTLTSSQTEVLNEILNDLTQPSIMHRMLQGDTGSGKTIVALIAMLAVMSSGQQVAFMAPTEILAAQHLATFNRFLANTNTRFSLLTGSMDTTEKKAVLTGLKTGHILGVVGTHALFSGSVIYKALGLVITDEQHRFGVNQRKQLVSKGSQTDGLYLSATPIPRTLALTLFNDMDISTLKDKPKNRKKIITKVMTAKDKTVIKDYMRQTLQKKEQIYVVAPTIETSTALHLFGVDTIYKVIKKRYPSARVALLHAKLDAAQKNATLEAFKNHDVDILVSTTVVEVGIDVPNATLMIIYHAERFGYAQLHQLRGRIGRSQLGGNCLLIYEGNDDIKQRLTLLQTVDDGFVLSEYDLKQRGFGDLIGTLQSGKSMDLFAHEPPSFELLKTLNKDAKATVEAYINNGESCLVIEAIMKQLKDA